MGNTLSNITARAAVAAVRLLNLGGDKSTPTNDDPIPKVRSGKTPRTPSLGRMYRERGQHLHVSRHLMTLPAMRTSEGVFIPEQVVAAPGRGETYNIKRNQRKRICKRGGINHVHAERHYGIRTDGRRSHYFEEM